MARTKNIKNGELETVETPDVIISTLTRGEVAGKIAEVQTKIDHLNVDLAAAEAEKVEWEDALELFPA